MLKIYSSHTTDGNQRLGSMLVSDAETLLKTYTYYEDDPLSPTGKGYQRPPTESRFPQIAADLKVHGVTPLIISERGRWKPLWRTPDTTIELGVEEVVELLARHGVSGDDVFSSVVDGQHRDKSGRLLRQREGLDLEVPFLLYTNLTWPEEVDRFNVINTTAKNLPRALVEVNRHAIFDPVGASSRDRQKQDIRDVVMALETDEDSIWHEQVNMTGGRNTDRPVTFEGLRRSTEQTFTGRLGLLSIEKKIELAKAFWQAAAQTWPDAWNGIPPTAERVNPETGEVEMVALEGAKYRIKDLAGVSALAKLANQILLEAWDDQTSELNMGIVRGRLARAKDVNWLKSRDNPDMSSQAGFSGTADTYDMLLARTYGTEAAVI
jgi:DGQHR domain-containing protein